MDPHLVRRSQSSRSQHKSKYFVPIFSKPYIKLEYPEKRENSTLKLRLMKDCTENWHTFAAVKSISQTFEKSNTMGNFSRGRSILLASRSSFVSDSEVVLEVS